MTMTLRALLLVALAYPIAMAQAEGPPLDVKPGLWEMTVQPQMGAASIPPQTVKQCVSAEKLRQGFAVGDQSRGTCRPVSVRSSAKVLDVREECKGESGNWLITAHYEALTPETLRGTGQIARSDMPGAFNSTVAGRWLAADCGGVR